MPSPHPHRPAQHSLPFRPGRGGRRRNAGRKRIAPRPLIPHRARPEHKARHPVHVTLRSDFRQLRSQYVFPTVCVAIAGATRRAPDEFRVVHFSVQSNHVHLVVEASDKQALAAGMRSVAIRIARYVNQLLSRRGRLWADRWHGRDLTSPRAVRNALVYVLANFRKHAHGNVPPGIDAFSSAGRFDGFGGCMSGRSVARAGPPLAARHVAPNSPLAAALASFVAVSPARTWLAAQGWRRHGLIRIDEHPRSD
jgi:putative transposase